MSSPKVTIKGIVKSVGDIEFIGEKRDFPKQRIIIYKPAFTDEFGQQKGKPDYFPFDILGDKVDMLNITEHHIGKKVECEVYFSGSEFQKSDTSFGYAINANLSKITIVGTAPRTVAQSEPNEDDLPF